MTAPLISVIITAYNYGDTLAAAIESVLGQAYSNLEVLILDNASSDGTPGIAAQYVHDARVRYIRHPVNIGMIPNHNAGLGLARGQYLCFLSADDIMMPGYLDRAFGYLRDHPDIDIAYSAVYFINAGGKFTGYRDHEFYAAYNGGRNEFAGLLSMWAYMCLPSMLVRRDIYERYGGFDENIYGADYEIIVRWAAAGLRFAYVPEPWVAFRLHPQQHSGKERFSKTGLQARDHFTIIERYVTEGRAEQLRGYEHSIARQCVHLYNAVVKEGFEDDGTLAAALAQALTRIEHIHTLNSRSAAKPKLSIVVLYNGVHRNLEATLESLIAQDCPDWEAVVIAQPGISLESLCRRLDPQGRVRCLMLVQPLSQVESAGAAAMIANGNLLMFVRSGNTLGPNFVSESVRLAIAGSASAFIARSALRVYDEDFCEHRFEDCATDRPQLDDLSVAPCFPLEALVLRRELLDRGGKFIDAAGEFWYWHYLLTVLPATTFAYLDAWISNLAYSAFPHQYTDAVYQIDALRAVYDRHPVAAGIALRRMEHLEAITDMPMAQPQPGDPRRPEALACAYRLLFRPEPAAIPA